MTDNAVTRVNVRILEKEYQVACPASERDDLLHSSQMLNEQMRQIRDSGKVVGLDRIAVMAALNITNELIKVRDNEPQIDPNFQNKLQTMRERVEAALEQGQQLEL